MNIHITHATAEEAIAVKKRLLKYDRALIIKRVKNVLQFRDKPKPKKKPKDCCK